MNNLAADLSSLVAAQRQKMFRFRYENYHYWPIIHSIRSTLSSKSELYLALALVWLLIVALEFIDPDSA